jgi:hypothetical protein
MADRDLTDDENANKDQIFSFFSMFYMNFDYMIQTLTLVKKEPRQYYLFVQFICFSRLIIQQR